MKMPAPNARNSFAASCTRTVQPRWRKAIASRPAVERAYALAKRVNTKPANHDEESRRILFGQSKDVVK